MTNEKLAELLTLDRSDLPTDGGHCYNRLIFARSPYLLQHAENPVDWREWGEEAFTEARRRDIPLFISIGYSTCHWCHVMAAESFSDNEVATLLNGSFVPVKVDREERPDLDDLYMAASQTLTGSGGWPLNVFVDHDKRPFFTVTYLPKLPRHNTPGLMDLLGNIATLWKERRELITKNAAELCRSVSQRAPVPSEEKSISAVAAEACHQIAEMFDRRYGGFGRGAKFPMPVYLMFLLSRNRNAIPGARAMAVKTLESIVAGGIHDQIGGGFHRYTVDNRWQVPHFEKMLYDQALLLDACIEAAAVTGDKTLLTAATDTARFAVRELLVSPAGFGAGLDADSNGEEGFYYTWPFEELRSLLENDLNPLLAYWGADPDGDLDSRCVLRRVAELESFAAQHGLAVEQVPDIIGQAATRLLSVREKRVKPLRDPKIICSWNGLMVASLAKLHQAAGEVWCLETAEAVADFILKQMITVDGRLVRNWLSGPSTIPAFAEDYACLGLGIAELAKISPLLRWEESLRYLTEELSRLFVHASGEVSFSGIDGEKLPIQLHPVQDGVIPSAAGLCATLLIRAGRILRDERFQETGAQIIRTYRGITEQHPAACLSLIMAEEELNGATLETEQ